MEGKRKLKTESTESYDINEKEITNSSYKRNTALLTVTCVKGA